MVCLLKKTETKKKKNKETLKIRGCKLHPNVIILHTDKGPKTWGDFSNWEPLACTKGPIRYYP